jgi:hypothetical protein
MTPLEIEPAIFRIVVRCLNQLSLGVPINRGRVRIMKVTKGHFNAIQISVMTENTEEK